MGEYKINEKSFKNIFDEYFDQVCGFLNLYTKDLGVIEDIVQDIFYKLWVNRDFLQIRHVKSYLYTSARNRMLNHIRDQKLHSSLISSYTLEEKELRDAYEFVDKEEFDKILEEVIEELPEKCKNVFKLSRFDKMTYKEIANKEGISVKMVEKHISVALKNIKGKMKNISFILF
ncbi:MAG: RNA polymerase sigma-70 factor [Bacteroidales bacterium]|jgi:RNA polymerase sigma-70 factor (ECF subfamily)|nr:RNA polymerase sigma-70 factor [Bacteroidales bacterium]